MTLPCLCRGCRYRYYSGVPLVPFGHGGSYSQFQYSGLAVSKPSFAVCEAPTVTFSVASTNGKVGDAVTLVFVTGPAQGGVHPRTNLGNFTRVTAVGSTGTTATIEVRTSAHPGAFFQLGSLPLITWCGGVVPTSCHHGALHPSMQPRTSGWFLLASTACGWAQGKRRLGKSPSRQPSFIAASRPRVHQPLSMLRRRFRCRSASKLRDSAILPPLGVFVCL